MYSLVFFLLAILPACDSHHDKIAFAWDKDNHATGILIPSYLLHVEAGVPIESSLKVTLADGNQNILGTLSEDGDAILFTPVIPPSPGLTYKIIQAGKYIGEIKVPLSNINDAPKIVAIYPQGDTLPENNLKFYLQFSHPMLTGSAIDHITLLDGKDTLHDVFLNLQPELWDTTGKVLTLWLDPGRIKRGLVLNRERGNPLKKADKYRLVVSSKWKDSRGLNLQEYSKEFVAGAWDDQQPDINKWGINLPSSDTKNPLVIKLNEPLDHYLLQESIVILNSKGAVVNGAVRISDNDTVWSFTPTAPWQKDDYTLRVNSKLEDLAGNNLNKVFDRDITKQAKRDELYYQRKFAIVR
ncbi:hypothetical protein GCM10027049_06770 [Mucilaginibacter puniceus]